MNCLITAIGSMSAEAVIGAIRRRGAATIIGCNLHPRHWVPAARLVDGFHQVPPAQDATLYVTRLMEICLSDGISHIIVLTDPEVDVLSAQRDQFEAIGVTLCLPDRAAVSLARDKLGLYRHFSEQQRIQLITTLCLHDPLAATLSFPLLAKPRYGRSSQGQQMIPDISALTYWQARLYGQDHVIQPWLAGEVFVTDLVLQPEHNRCAAVTRHELLRTSNGAGITVEMHPGHTCDALAIEVARSIGLRGCINMEFLVVDGQPLLMDVNPRFSAGVAFSMLAGYDMASNHLNCFSGAPIDVDVPLSQELYARGYVEYPAGKAYAAT